MPDACHHCTHPREQHRAKFDGFCAARGCFCEGFVEAPPVPNPPEPVRLVAP